MQANCDQIDPQNTLWVLQQEDDFLCENISTADPFIKSFSSGHLKKNFLKEFVKEVRSKSEDKSRSDRKSREASQKRSPGRYESRSREKSSDRSHESDRRSTERSQKPLQHSSRRSPHRSDRKRRISSRDSSDGEASEARGHTRRFRSESQSSEKDRKKVARLEYPLKPSPPIFYRVKLLKLSAGLVIFLVRGDRSLLYGSSELDRIYVDGRLLFSSMSVSEVEEFVRDNKKPVHVLVGKSSTSVAKLSPDVTVKITYEAEVMWAGYNAHQIISKVPDVRQEIIDKEKTSPSAVEAIVETSDETMGSATLVSSSALAGKKVLIQRENFYVDGRPLQETSRPLSKVIQSGQKIFCYFTPKNDSLVLSSDCSQCPLEMECAFQATLAWIGDMPDPENWKSVESLSSSSDIYSTVLPKVTEDYSKVHLQMILPINDQQIILGTKNYKLIEELKTYVQFPTDKHSPHRDSVSIFGSVEDVERIRTFLRQMQPIHLEFDVQGSTFDVADWTPELSKSFEEYYDVQISVTKKEKGPFKLTNFYLVGCYGQVAKLWEAVQLLSTKLFGPDSSTPVTLLLEMTSPTRESYFGKFAEKFHKKISFYKAEIRFSRPFEKDPLKKGPVLITGFFHDAIRLLQVFFDYWPLIMKIRLPTDTVSSEERRDILMKCPHISKRWKGEEIELCTGERLSNFIYEEYQRIKGIVWHPSFENDGLHLYRKVSLAEGSTFHHGDKETLKSLTRRLLDSSKEGSAEIKSAKELSVALAAAEKLLLAVQKVSGLKAEAKREPQIPDFYLKNVEKLKVESEKCKLVEKEIVVRKKTPVGTKPVGIESIQKHESNISDELKKIFPRIKPVSAVANNDAYQPSEKFSDVLARETFETTGRKNLLNPLQLALKRNDEKSDFTRALSPRSQTTLHQDIRSLTSEVSYQKRPSFWDPFQHSESSKNSADPFGRDFQSDSKRRTNIRLPDPFEEHPKPSRNFFELADQDRGFLSRKDQNSREEYQPLDTHTFRNSQLNDNSSSDNSSREKVPSFWERAVSRPSRGGSPGTSRRSPPWKRSSQQESFRFGHQDSANRTEASWNPGDRIPQREEFSNFNDSRTFPIRADKFNGRSEGFIDRDFSHGSSYDRPTPEFSRSGDTFDPWAPRSDPDVFSNFGDRQGRKDLDVPLAPDFSRRGGNFDPWAARNGPDAFSSVSVRQERKDTDDLYFSRKRPETFSPFEAPTKTQYSETDLRHWNVNSSRESKEAWEENSPSRFSTELLPFQRQSDYFNQSEMYNRGGPSLGNPRWSDNAKESHKITQGDAFFTRRATEDRSTRSSVSDLTSKLDWDQLSYLVQNSRRNIHS